MVFGLVAALITWSTSSTEPSKRAPATVTHLRDAGNVDQVTYDEQWGGVWVDMAGPVISRRAELEALGWEVRVLE